MGQLLISTSPLNGCGCCPKPGCCAGCRLLSAYPCGLYYYTDGNPFQRIADTIGYLHAKGDEPFNLDVNGTTLAFDPGSGQYVPLGSIAQLSHPGTPCSWSTGDFVVAPSADQTQMLLTLTIPNFYQFIYSLPFAQFQPCNNVENSFQYTSQHSLNPAMPSYLAWPQTVFINSGPRVGSYYANPANWRVGPPNPMVYPCTCTPCSVAYIMSTLNGVPFAYTMPGAVRLAISNWPAPLFNPNPVILIYNCTGGYWQGTAYAGAELVTFTLSDAPAGQGHVTLRVDTPNGSGAVQSDSENFGLLSIHFPSIPGFAGATGLITQ